jgi:hypothetical protein
MLLHCWIQLADYRPSDDDRHERLQVHGGALLSAASQRLKKNPREREKGARLLLEQMQGKSMRSTKNGWEGDGMKRELEA